MIKIKKITDIFELFKDEYLDYSWKVEHSTGYMFLEYLKVKAIMPPAILFIFNSNEPLEQNENNSVAGTIEHWSYYIEKKENQDSYSIHTEIYEKFNQFIKAHSEFIIDNINDSRHSRTVLIGLGSGSITVSDKKHELETNFSLIII